MRFEWGKFWDLVAIVFFSLILIPTIQFMPDNLLRIVIGLPFILFFPGYSLISLLFPSKQSLDTIERIALSFGLSIAITPLIGLGLNYTPFGIRLEPILASISAFNIICSIGSMKRRIDTKDPFLPFQLSQAQDLIKTTFKQENKIDRALNIILAIAIAASLITLVYVVAVPKQGEKFTEFYILGPGGKASDYPTNLTVGQEGNITIGIANHEYRTVAYYVELWLVNASFVDNQTIIHHMYWYDNFTVTLEHTSPNVGGNWTKQYERPYTYSFDNTGQFKLWFLLFDANAPTLPSAPERMKDFVGTSAEQRIVDAVEGSNVDMLSLNLNMRVSAP